MNLEDFKNLKVGDLVRRSGTLDTLTILTEGDKPTAGLVRTVDSPQEWGLVAKKVFVEERVV